RVLYARIGTATCPQCNVAIAAQSPEKITAMMQENFNGLTVTIAAPIARAKKGEFVQELLQHYEQGYYQFIINGQRVRFSNKDEINALKLGKSFKHSIDLLLDVIE